MGEEKRRTLLRLFFLDVCELANPENNKTGMLWLVVLSLSRKLFKNNPGEEENMHRGSETKFPW